MRQSIVFFVLGLIVLSKAEVNVFAQIDQNPFGQTLLNLVQMNMQSNSQAEMTQKSSIANIQELLDDLQDGVKKQLATQKISHKSYQEKAIGDIELFGRIAQGQQLRIGNTNQAAINDKKSLQENTADYKRALSHLQDVKGQISQAKNSHNGASEQFRSKSAQLAAAIQQCKAANSELSKLKYGLFAEGQSINMVQIKAGMEKIQIALSEHLPNRLTIYKPIISALVDMGAKSDPALVKKVQGLIAQLRNALEGELSVQAANEKIRIANFNQLVVDLSNDARNTQERIGRDIAVGKALQRNIVTGSQILSLLKLAYADSTQLLANRQQEATNEQVTYAKQVVISSKQTVLLKTLSSHIRTNLSGSFGKFIQKRQFVQSA